MNTEAVAPRLEQAINAIALLVAAAAALYLLLALYVGGRDLATAVAQLGASALLGGLLFASLNYLLRFGRWQDLLRRMEQAVPRGENLRVYIGGLALTATPGKLGETIRSALLLRCRVPVGASLAAFLIDRLTDLAGVLLLTALSGGGRYWWVLTAVALAIGFVARAACSDRGSAAVLRWLQRFPRLAPLRTVVDTARAPFIAAWHAPRVLAYVCVALAAYGVQGLVFAAYVERLWPAADWLASLHIFATATLAGAASLIPGGLGATEIALIGQLVAGGMPLTAATAAALCVRAVTLWFAIMLGLLCLLWYRQSASSGAES